MAGTYAPPAVQGPITTEIWGMERADTGGLGLVVWWMRRGRGKEMGGEVGRKR